METDTSFFFTLSPEELNEKALGYYHDNVTESFSYYSDKPLAYYRDRLNNLHIIDFSPVSSSAP